MFNPALLTETEQAHLRAALYYMRARIGSWAVLARAVRSKRISLLRIRRGLRIGGMRSLAGRLADVAGVPVADVLAGRLPPPGVCPHCGHALSE